VPVGTAVILWGTHTAGGSSSITARGQLTVSGGTPNLAGLVNLSGSNTFSSGTANLSGIYICTNNTLTISGGTSNFNGNGFVPASVVTLSGGTLGGSSAVTVLNQMNRTGGTMSGGGQTILQPAATLNKTNARTVTFASRTLENGGTVLWAGAGVIAFTSNRVITNRPGALFRAEGEAANGPGGGRFVNADTFRKSAGVGTTTLASGLNFTNSGTVDIRSGIRAANGGYVSSSNALLNCALGGTAAGTNYGQLKVVGTVTLNGALSVDLSNGFSPALNDSFTVVSGAHSGTFANFHYPSNTVMMQMSNTPNSVLVRVTGLVSPEPIFLPPELSSSNITLIWTAVWMHWRRAIAFIASASCRDRSTQNI